MKKVILAVITSLALVSAFAEAETKQVCKDKLDKTGKPIKKADGSAAQECKTIKVHKKLEGTKVEDAKKK
jgi:hypothetical protein